MNGCLEFQPKHSLPGAKKYLLEAQRYTIDTVCISLVSCKGDHFVVGCCSFKKVAICLSIANSLGLAFEERIILVVGHSGQVGLAGSRILELGWPDY